MVTLERFCPEEPYVSKIHEQTAEHGGIASLRLVMGPRCAWNLGDGKVYRAVSIAGHRHDGRLWTAAFYRFPQGCVLDRTILEVMDDERYQIIYMHCSRPLMFR